MKTSLLMFAALAVCASGYPPHFDMEIELIQKEPEHYPPHLDNMELEIINNEPQMDTRTCKIPSIFDLNVDDPDTPSPLTVNECLEDGLERDANPCPELNCSNDCLVPDLDNRGCLTSCACKSSGLWGDIMLSEEDVSMFESNRAGSRNSKRWMGVIAETKDKRKVYVIYYTYASSIMSNNRAQRAIDEAREAYYKDTCILFYPKPDDYKGDYIQFFSGSGCYSSLGRMARGMQRISIGRGCEYKGIVMHEMMHSMGFWHEQARPDRDQYVAINWGNIKQGRQSQFQMMAAEKINSFGSPYDMDSIMQYDGMSFNSNGRPTIVDKKTGKAVKGQRRGFSEQDIAQIRAMYNCDDM